MLHPVGVSAQAVRNHDIFGRILMKLTSTTVLLALGQWGPESLKNTKFIAK